MENLEISLSIIIFSLYNRIDVQGYFFLYFSLFDFEVPCTFFIG